MDPVSEVPLPPQNLDAARADMEARMGRSLLSDEDLLLLAALSIRDSATFMERGYR